MKFFLTIFIFAFFIVSNVKSETSLKWNKIYSGGEVTINSIKFNLPKGKWLLLSIDRWSVKTITYISATFVKEENKILKEIINMGALDTAGTYTFYVDTWLYENFFSKNNTDGCFDQRKYYYFERKKRNVSVNCFIVRHEDVEKELWSPEMTRGQMGLARPFNDSWVRKWVRDKKIILPSIMLSSDHYHFNKKSGRHVTFVSHSINPEFYNGPKTKFVTVDSSEYHKLNIENYPNVKKYMANFVENSALQHQEFENLIKAKEEFKLEFNELNLEKKSIKTSDNNEFINQLNELKKLFDDGILTKEEFVKAKNKILN